MRSRSTPASRLCSSFSPSGFKNYSYGQSDLTIDLANNPEILSKFTDVKGFKKYIKSLSNWLEGLELYFRSPDPIDLNRIQKFLLKVIVLMLIFADWVITTY